MKLLLDAHVSGPRVGRALEEAGHDVRAVDQEKDLERLPDDLLFELAVSDNRILVTHNVGDFLRIVKNRPPEKSHAGLILVPHTVRLEDFGTIIRGTRSALESLSREDWVDRIVWIRR